MSVNFVLLFDTFSMQSSCLSDFTNCCKLCLLVSQKLLPFRKLNIFFNFIYLLFMIAVRKWQCFLHYALQSLKQFLLFPPRVNFWYNFLLSKIHLNFPMKTNILSHLDILNSFSNNQIYHLFNCYALWMNEMFISLEYGYYW